MDNWLKLFLVLCVFTATISKSHAQVTIGANDPPEKAALLDVKTQNGGVNGTITSQGGGILLPRVIIKDDITKLSQFPDIVENLDTDEQKERHKGLMIYNIEEDHSINTEKGIYVWNGEFWEKAAFRNRVNFFYMPSMMLDTSLGQHTKNLYDEYIRQFTNPKAASPGAPEDVPFFVNPTDLYYYVIDFDPNIFETQAPDQMTISADGVLTYTVKAPPVDGKSYINILFVVKY